MKKNFLWFRLQLYSIFSMRKVADDLGRSSIKHFVWFRLRFGKAISGI